MSEKIIKYPTEEECMEIIDKSDMLPNILEHSIQVKNVSLFIYERLHNKSMINRGIIIAAALLHDIAKTKSIRDHMHHHDLRGGDMLREMGYDTVADIIENHVIFRDFDEHGDITEKDILYYSDKRVMHNCIVDIETRINDIAERYGHDVKQKQHILDNKKFVQKVEDKIQRFTSSSIRFIEGQE